MAEVYGTTAFVEDGRDKIKALLDTLVTAMATGYDPTLSYVYDGHHTADIRLNAATVDFVDAEWSEEGVDAANRAVGILWSLTYSVRVHVAYVGGIQDDVKTGRLLNSVANKLLANRSLDDGYGIDEVSNFVVGEEFPHTKGGYLAVVVHKYVEHTQE